MNAATTAGATATIERTAEETELVRLEGDWRLAPGLPGAAELLAGVASGPPPRRIAFDSRALAAWDSGLLNFLKTVQAAAQERGVPVDATGLPEGVQALLRLATAVPEQTGARRDAQARPPLLARAGLAWLGFRRASGEAVSFIGSAVLSFGRFATGRARVRWSDILLTVQQCGPQALPIVALISILVGLILAFVGSVQLRLFGAEVYVANLVAIGMTREMGAMMTAIIMAGRTGAAFAAQLGTMQVNEEIDALTTLGVEPHDFLVLPRMLALIAMMPLLCIYADVLGILGGMIVGVGMLDITPQQYWNQTIAWVRPSFVLYGVGKSILFGVIIALSGCLRGMQCGRSAAAVGAAATSAVVTAIVWIIVADGVCAVLSTVLHI